MSALAYIAVSGLGLTVAILLLMIFVAWADRLIRLGISGNFFYILLFPLGLSAAAFVFGGMRSYGILGGTPLPRKAEGAGPALVAALVVIGGFILVPSVPTTFSITARLELPDGRPAADAKVSIFYGDVTRTEPASPNGEVNYKAIPYKYIDTMTSVRLESTRYELSDKGRTYQIKPDVPLLIDVVPTEGYKAGYKVGFSIGKIRRSIVSFHQISGKYANSLEELNQKIDISQHLESLGRDKVQYRPDHDLGYIFRHAGADDLLGTQDDVVITMSSK